MTDRPSETPHRAVIGGGVSGLTAAYLLQRTHHVTLFEADPRVGGHAHTHDVEMSDGSTVPVDSGFIVISDRTYPMLRKMFGELGVDTRPTEMSMSISCDGCGLAFTGGRNANGIFSQRRRLLDPKFLRLLLQIRRFQKEALAFLENAPGAGTADVTCDGMGEGLTNREFLAAHGCDAHFVTHYALPVVSCVWSMGHNEALAYPAAYLFAFLRHHGFLALGDSPTWHTVVGGSRSYVDAITARLDVVRNGTRVTAVSRKPDSVELDTASIEGGRGDHHSFDKVVIATHANEALSLLTDAGEEEQEPRELDLPARGLRHRHRADPGLLLDEPVAGTSEGDPLIVTLNPSPGPRPGACDGEDDLRAPDVHRRVGRRPVAAAFAEHRPDRVRRRLPSRRSTRCSTPVARWRSRRS